jgi:hypothetical protein
MKRPRKPTASQLTKWMSFVAPAVVVALNIVLELIKRG